MKTDKLEELYKMIEAYQEGTCSLIDFLFRMDDHIRNHGEEISTLNPRAYNYLENELKKLSNSYDRGEDQAVIREKIDRMYEKVRTMHHRIKLDGVCPKCRLNYEVIYQNLEDRKRIYCSYCGLMYNVQDARRHGYDNLIDYWKSIAEYLPQA